MAAAVDGKTSGIIEAPPGVYGRANELLNYQSIQGGRSTTLKVSAAIVLLFALVGIGVSIYMGVGLNHTGKWLRIPVILTAIFTLALMGLFYYDRKNPPAPPTLRPSEALEALQKGTDANPLTNAALALIQHVHQASVDTTPPEATRHTVAVLDIRRLHLLENGAALPADLQKTLSLVHLFIQENENLFILRGLSKTVVRPDSPPQGSTGTRDVRDPPLPRGGADSGPPTPTATSGLLPAGGEPVASRSGSSELLPPPLRTGISQAPPAAGGSPKGPPAAVANPYSPPFGPDMAGSGTLAASGTLGGSELLPPPLRTGISQAPPAAGGSPKGPPVAVGHPHSPPFGPDMAGSGTLAASGTLDGSVVFVSPNTSGILPAKRAAADPQGAR